MRIDIQADLHKCLRDKETGNIYKKVIVDSIDCKDRFEEIDYDGSVPYTRPMMDLRTSK